MDSNICSSTALLFVTHGIFLNYLTHRPEVLSEYTHVIVDEVHERDLDSDFILILLKLFLFKVPKLRVVLMSATIDSQSFANYFSPREIARVSQLNPTVALQTPINSNSKPKRDPNKAAKKEWADIDYSDYEVKGTWNETLVEKGSGKDVKVEKTDQINLEKEEATESSSEQGQRVIEIGGLNLHSIKILYLDELEQLEGLKSQTFSSLNMKTCIFSKPSVNLELLHLAANLVEYLLQNHVGSLPGVTDSNVLVFLPGLNEINSFIDLLSLSHNKAMQVIPFHSTVSDLYSGEIFNPTPNVQKVIVATNIAESSITIPDVGFVIDFCLTKEYKFNLKIQNEQLKLEWASKASCRQRAGRTGRVRDGTCFRLVTKQFFQELPDFRQPEILRSPLDKILLKIALLHLELRQKSEESNIPFIDRNSSEGFGWPRGPVERSNDFQQPEPSP